MQNNKFQIPVAIILLCFLLIMLPGCSSDSNVVPETIEEEEVAEPDSEALDNIVADESEEAEPFQEVESEPSVKVVVNVDVLRLRSGPSTNHEILDRLFLGTILEVIAEDGEWIQVDFRNGWVHGDYVVKPEDPEKLYEVLSVKVQPVGYTKEQVTSFIEESTSFSLDDFVLPEFNHPNDLKNEDLISAITLNGCAPEYKDFSLGFIITGKDIQETAKSIFGSDLKGIEHTSVFPYYWNNEDQIYQAEGFGPGSYTETKVINIKETSEEFIVDAVHLIYYYSSYDDEYVSHVTDELSRYDHDAYDSYEDFTENAITLVDEEHNDGTIDKYINSFPVRRYILSKDGEGVCYIRQSYLLYNQ